MKEELEKQLEGDIERALKTLECIYPEFNSKDVHNVRTPHRIAKMWVDMFKGLDEMDFEFTKFPNDGSETDWVILKDIEFASMCFPNKTRIRTANGVKFIKDVKVGDSILTFTNSGDLIEKKVTEVFKRKSEKLISLKTKKGKKIECTPEHPIYIKGKGWTEAKDIQEGDLVYTLRNAKGFVRTSTACNINYGKDLGYFLGCLLSDGSVSGNQVRLEVTEKWFAEKFANSIKSTFGLDAQVETIPYASGFKGKDPSKNLYRVRVVSGYLVNIVDELCNGRKKTKTFTLPKIIFNDYETFCGFFEGYIDGDGTEYENGKHKYNRVISSNTKFISDISQIFETNPSPMSNCTCYTVTVPLFLNKRNQRKLYEEKFIKRFNECYKNKEKVEVDKFREVDEIVDVKCRNKKGNKPFTVYNFEVEDEHTYIANDVWVHNCQHHFMPFSGVVHIGYKPYKTICGISKLARVVDYFASRPQVQERLGKEIYDFLNKELSPCELVVIIESRHTCVGCRGIKSRNSKMITTKTMYEESLGEFKELIR